MGRRRKRNPHKLTTDELRRKVALMQKKGIVSKIRNLKQSVPEASTRFQLQLELAGRKEIGKQKKKIKRSTRRSLLNLYRELRA